MSTTMEQTFTTYEAVENYQVNYPVSSFEKFNATCEHCFATFHEGNEIMRLIDEGKLEMKHYHSLLRTLYHQVYVAGSTTLAAAGVMGDGRYFKFREYMFKHAEEEQNHWKWIIQDLRNTGYTGPDPREEFPSFVAEAYRSFSMHFSLKYPMESIAISYILEGISSKLGLLYGYKAATQLKLTKEYMQFFLIHGELDQGHEHEIVEVIKDLPLTPHQWAIAEYAAVTTLHFYREMYNWAAVNA